jgi:hypothetical protein
VNKGTHNIFKQNRTLISVVIISNFGTILCTFKWRNETLFLKTLQSDDRSLTLLKLQDDSDREGPGFCDAKKT